MNSQVDFNKKFKQEYWGRGDECFRHTDVYDLVNDLIDDACGELDIEDSKDFSGTFSIEGGDSMGCHFSSVISNIDEAREWLNASAESNWSAKECANANCSCLEEWYYECIMEGGDESFDPYELEKSTARTIDRVFYRACKPFKKAFESENEEEMDRIARTFLRRFKRATRHLPIQNYGPLTNYNDYDVTVVNGEIVDMVLTRHY